MKMNLFVFSFWLGLYVAFYFYASTSPLEHYKDIAQAPGTGVHESRILPNATFGIFDYPVTRNGFALVDTAATLFTTRIISLLTGHIEFLYRWMIPKTYRKIDKEYIHDRKDFWNLLYSCILSFSMVWTCGQVPKRSPLNSFCAFGDQSS